MKNKVLKYLKIIPFENLKEEEKKLVWRWRNNEKIRNLFFNPNFIPYEDHIKFIKLLKSSKDKKYFLVKYKDEYIGVFNFTNIKNENNKKLAELGTYINPENSKPAYAYLVGLAMKQKARELGIAKLIAYVFPNNQAAIKYNKFLGFKEKGIIQLKKYNKNFEVLKMELNFEEENLK